MKQRNPLSIRYIALLVLPVALGGLFFFYPTHATPLPIPSANDILNANQALLLYSGSVDGNSTVQALQASSTSHVVSDFGNVAFQNYNKELYLSPDRKLIAVTLNPLGTEGWPDTYISSINGTQITPAHLGDFVSWAPDSSKVLLYISPMESPWVRKIYALDVQGKYYDTGLPNGTINADISPIDASIVYSLTSGGTDNSSIYVRNPQGNDRLLLRGNNNVITWTRWSPKGDKIAFLKSDLYISQGTESLDTVEADGTGQETVSSVDWNYPPIWSPDGTKIAFSNAGNIWEYDSMRKSLRNVTNLDQSGALHPSYSGDGSTIVFSANVSGENQIFAAQNGVATKLTDAGQEKDYPILP